MRTKTCTKCNKTKPLSEFHKKVSRKDGHRSHCKTCVSKSARKYRAEHREEERARSRKWYAEHREERRAYKRNQSPEVKAGYQLKHYYGITLTDYNEMLEAQGGGCAICGTTPEEEGRRLCVDHNHETGEVRGLLCKACSRGVGYLRDSEELCLQAASYLAQESAKSTGPKYRMSLA